MMTKKMTYIHPSMNVISMELEETILNGSAGGDIHRPQVPGVGASSWADGNDDWFTPKKDENSIWR